MTAPDTDRLTEWANENWLLFRQHHPVGAYLPVGQLDGDCSCGRGSWPCDTLRPTIDALLTEQRERIAGAIEAEGRADVQWLAETAEDSIDRARHIGAEDAYKAAIRIAREGADHE